MDNNELDQEESAIEKDNDFIGRKTKSVPAPKQEIGIDTDKKITDDLIQAGINHQIDISSIDSFNQRAQSREEVCKLIDLMCEDSLIAAVLETYAEDATEYNDQGQIIWAESSDAKIGKYINFLLDSMRVDKHIYKWVYSLCKYGDCYIRLYKESEIEDDFFKPDKKQDLKEDAKIRAYKQTDRYAHYVKMEPNPSRMFELSRFGKSVGYIRADVTTSVKQENLLNSYYKYRFKKDDIEIYDPTMYVHAILDDDASREEEEVSLFLNQENMDSDTGITYSVRKGKSLLYDAFKIWREMQLLENAMLLSRLTRSSIVRVVSVEVGDMPKEMVGPHLQGVKQLMEQKSAISAGNSLSEYTNPGPTYNNIYVPTNNGKGAVSSSEIGGDSNVTGLDDIDYFRQKLFGALRVPAQYFGFTNDSTGFNGGTSLTIISSRYAKMIKRIQNSIVQAVVDLINLILIDKNLPDYINKFSIKMQTPTTQEEIDRRDYVSNQIQVTRDVVDLCSEIDDPATKLKITKSLLSNVITNTEVTDILQEYIDKLESGEVEDETDNGDEDFDDFGGGPGGGSSSGGDDGLFDLDAEMGLTDEEGSEDELSSDESSDDTLPSPEELGVGDLTDNTADLG